MPSKKSSRRGTVKSGEKLEKKEKDYVTIASTVAMLVGIAFVLYGYLSYHNPFIWIGILAVMLGLWWIALIRSGRSPITVHK